MPKTLYLENTQFLLCRNVVFVFAVICFDAGFKNVYSFSNSCGTVDFKQ